MHWDVVPLVPPGHRSRYRLFKSVSREQGDFFFFGGGGGGISCHSLPVGTASWKLKPSVAHRVKFPPLCFMGHDACRVLQLH